MEEIYYSIRSITKGYTLGRAYKQLLERSQINLDLETMNLYQYMVQLSTYEYHEVDDECIIISSLRDGKKEFKLNIAQRPILKRYILLSWTNVILGPDSEENYSQALMDKILILEPKYSMLSIYKAMKRNMDKVISSRRIDTKLLYVKYIKFINGKIIGFNM